MAYVLRPAWVPEFVSAGIVVISGVGMTLAILVYGLPRMGRDSYIHAAWYSNFTIELLQGDIYPRWLVGMNEGFGSPTFYSYGPGAYWISSLFESVCSDAYGWCQLGWSISLAMVASGLASYAWLRMIAGRAAAIIGALAYMLMPYHSIHTLFVRSSVSEMWGFVWMPVILLGTHHMIKGNQWGLLIFVFGALMLNMTHLATAVVFVGVPFIYAACLVERGRLMNSVVKVFCAFALGAALAGPYIIPYLLSQEFVAMKDELGKGWFLYSDHFIDTTEYSKREARFAFTIAAFAACAALACLYRPRSKATRQIWGWIFAAVASLFMMTSLSNFVYRIIPLLQSLEFPWRYSSVLVLAVAPLVAFAISAVIARPHLVNIISIGICLIFLGYMGFYMVKKQYWMVYNLQHREEEVSQKLREKIDSAFDLPGYRPKWVDRKFWDLDRDKMLAAMAESQIFKSTHVPVSRAGVRTLVSEVPLNGPGWVVLGHFYYPYWVATDERGGQLMTKPVLPEGLVAVNVPDGSQRVFLKLKMSFPETLGWVTGLLGLLLASFVGRWFRSVKFSCAKP